MLTTQIQSLFEDSSFVEELKSAASPDGMRDVFKRHGVELSDEDFAEFLKTPTAELQGEIDESQLDEVSGGGIIKTLAGIAGAAWKWSVSIHGSPEAAFDYTVKWWVNKLTKK